jgi:hypothetical protein
MTDKEKVKQTEGTIEQKLINSHAVNSLSLETLVYDKFKKLKWNVAHSPYYIDAETKKFREIDITARKYWRSPKSIDLTCAVNFIVECKTLKDYHIIASNRLEHKVGTDLIHCWIGQDVYTNYSKSIELLTKNNISNDRIRNILKELNSYCYPEVTFRFYEYNVTSFDIPVFNSFRETNIGTTKYLDNSVVWKSFQSLYSCVDAYNSLVWEGIDYHLYDVERENLLNEEERAEELKKMLLLKAGHMIYLHPILVIESNLWEVVNKKLKKLKYLRLIFQKLFEDELWIDIVSKDHLDEYLVKTKQYDTFLRKKKFR